MKFFFSKRNIEVPVNIEPVAVAAAESGAGAKDEIAAVIALAVHIHLAELREYEQSIITMQKALKPYSPWSSKIYGLRPQLTHTPALKPALKKF